LSKLWGSLQLGTRARYLINVESAEFKGTFKITAVADPDAEKVKK